MEGATGIDMGIPSHAIALRTDAERVRYVERGGSGCDDIRVF